MHPAHTRAKALSSTVVMVLLVPVAMVALLPAAVADDAATSPWEGRVRVDNGPAKDRLITSVGLATGAPGELFAAWLEDRANGNDCYAAASADGGQTWSSDVRVNPVDNPTRPWNGSCDIEADPDDHVWVVYSQRVPNGWQVKFTRSDNDARTFRTPSDIYAVGEGESQRYPALARAPSGAVVVLFLHRTPTTSRLLLSVAEDGLNPGVPRQVDLDAPDDEQHVRGDVAVLPDGTVVVAYGYKTPGVAGVKVARKAPSGSDFSIVEAFNITEAVPRELFPRVAVSSGGVLEVAFDRGDGGGIVHVRSTDKGATFSTPQRVWTDPTTVENTDPALAFDSLGVFHVTFTRQFPSKPKVVHTYSADGETFTSPVEVGADWNESDDGARGREGPSDIVTLEGGSLAAAYAASRNNTYGVRASWWTNLPPVVTIDVPGDGTTVRGTVTVQGTADDPGGVSGIASLRVRMGALGPVELPGATGWAHDFDTTALPDGPVTVEAWAFDGFLEGEHTTIELNVDNNLPPVLDMREPVDDSDHAGLVRVMGYATDDQGFRENWAVQWNVDDGNWTDLGPGTLLDPLNVTFDRVVDLSHLDNGQHYMTFRVTDGAKWSEPWTAAIRLENRPDLRIDASRVDWTPFDMRQGDTVTITAYVENVGARPAPTSSVEFKVGPKVLALVGTPNIEPRSEVPLAFYWNATEGTYTFTIRVDPRAEVDEADETNNDAEFELQIAKAAEDKEPFPWLVVGIVIVIVVVALGALVYVSRLKAADRAERQMEGGPVGPPPDGQAGAPPGSEGPQYPGEGRPPS